MISRAGRPSTSRSALPSSLRSRRKILAGAVEDSDGRAVLARLRAPAGQGGQPVLVGKALLSQPRRLAPRRRAAGEVAVAGCWRLMDVAMG